MGEGGGRKREVRLRWRAHGGALGQVDHPLPGKYIFPWYS